MFLGREVRRMEAIYEIPKKRKAKSLSATQRTIRALREQGCLCDIAEKFNSHIGPFGARQDLFGFIDIVAIYPEGIVAIQSCAATFREHYRMIIENETAPEWLKHGGIELWAWRKVKRVKGGAAMTWKPRIHKFQAADFMGG